MEKEKPDHIPMIVPSGVSVTFRVIPTHWTKEQIEKRFPSTKIINMAGDPVPDTPATDDKEQKEENPKQK